MSDQLANEQLELGCRLGHLGAVIEALEEDGADINCRGGSPLFLSIMANERAIVAALVERGADIASYEISATDHDGIVDELMKLAATSVATSGDGPASSVESGMADLDAKLVRAFDRMIRNKGLAEPFRKRRGDEYEAFCEALKCLAAEDCYTIVNEFLEMVELVRSEIGEPGIPDFLEDNAARIAELRRRYVESEDLPGDLLKEYLREQKKIAKVA